MKFGINLPQPFITILIQIGKQLKKMSHLRKKWKTLSPYQVNLNEKYVYRRQTKIFFGQFWYIVL